MFLFGYTVSGITAFIITVLLHYTPFIRTTVSRGISIFQLNTLVLVWKSLETALYYFHDCWFSGIDAGSVCDGTYKNDKRTKLYVLKALSYSDKREQRLI